MTPGSAVRTEWRQFRLLSHDALRRLLDRAFYSRDSDPIHVLIWAVALMLTPPVLYACRRLLNYSLLSSSADDVVVRFATGDRLFFLTYGMLALTLLAALTWDAFFPDSREQEITATLPVRPRTAAAARFSAGAIAAVIVAGAITAPAALVYAIISASHPAIGPTVRVLAAHAISVVLCSLFVFFTLLSIRGLLAIAGNARITEWLARALQMITVVLLVDSLLFMPRVLPWLVDQTLDAGASPTWVAPVWFVALYSQIAGTRHAISPALWQLAVASVSVSAVTAIAIYLLSAPALSRRALLAREGERASFIVGCARRLARFLFRRGAARSIFVFATASLMRSRRHSTILATYVGGAIASGVIGVLAAGSRKLYRRGPRAHMEWGSWFPPLDEPASYLLAIPLVFVFFAVIGLRAASRVPTDADANWAFKLPQPALDAAASATQAFFLVFGAAPVLAATSVALFVLWPPMTAVRIAVFDVLAALLLVECALVRWGRIPFACEHVATGEDLKWRWSLYFVALNVFAFRVADLQMLALGSALGTTMYVVVASIAIVLIRFVRRRGMAQGTLEFEVAPGGAPAAFGLSGLHR